MRDDPRQTAAWLVQEHGLEQARRVALAATLQAQEDGDNYALSLWREVKHILANRTESEREEFA